MTHQDNILYKIYSEALASKASQSPLPLMIFDIDSTMLDVTGRNTKILHDFARTFSIRWFKPGLSKTLQTVQTASHDWGYQECFRRLRISLDESTDKKLYRFWKQHFFSNDYLIYDRPYAHSVEYINALKDLGVEIIYLTGRHHEKMWDGTVKSLQEHGYPSPGPGVELQLKTETSVTDEDFKLQYILNIDKRKYSKTWLVENEPVNLNMVLEFAPEVGGIFYDSVHSGRQKINEVHEKVKSFPKL